MHNALKQALPKEIGKFLPKDAEDALIAASKETQENRNNLVEKHFDKIFEFLDSEDATPTRIQVLSKSKDKIEKLSDTVYVGKKPSFEINIREVKYDYPLEIALIVIKNYTDSILKDLKGKNINPKEIRKTSGYYGKRKKGRWTKEEIENLPLDWVKSAIVTYYTASKERGKDDSCSKKDGVISALELKECKKIIRIGSVKKYLNSLDMWK